MAPPPAPPRVRSPLRRIARYLRPYRGQVWAMLVLALVGVAMAMAVPLLTKRVVDGPIREGGEGLVPLVGLVLLLGGGEALLAVVRRQVQASVGSGMERDIRDDLYAHLQRLPVAFHDQWQSGQLLSRATTDLGVIRRWMAFASVFLVVNVATFVVVIALLVSLYLPLALVAGTMVVPLVWVSTRFERQYVEVSRRVQDDQGDLATVVEEGAVGIRVIKAFGRGRHVGDQFAGGARTLHGSSMEAIRLRAHYWPLFDLVPAAALAAVVLGGAWAVEAGELSLGGLVAFTTLVLSLVWPVEALGWILAVGQEASTAAGRVFEVLDTEPAIADRPGAVDLDDDEVRGRIRFDDVRFVYPGTDAEVLRGVDLELEPGEVMALVGVTGSGKTTLASLVPRLYDVTSGRVTIDGHDVRDLTLSSLRRHVGVAFEDPTLFSASVRENLLLGWPDATTDDIERALDTAQAGFVHELPWGLDTRVGEQGLSLSGGQRQRLALARAIIGRPRVLVLDDPLSALDVHTEALVEEALARVLVGTTALVVVHRPSTVALADRVALLQGGRITAVGTHHELLETVPAYRSILSEEAADIDVREELEGIA